MKKTLLAISMICALIFTACKKEEDEKKPQEIDKVQWLTGVWENKSKEGLLTENWSRENDTVFNAACYFVHGKDTLHNEKIRLIQSDNAIIYSPTVKGENGNKPVHFKMTSINADELVFENPKHDYPQKIVYTKITADSLITKISGMIKGKPYSETYPMRRAENSEE